MNNLSNYCKKEDVRIFGHLYYPKQITKFGATEQEVREPISI